MSSFKDRMTEDTGPEFDDADAAPDYVVPAYGDDPDDADDADDSDAPKD